MNLPDAFAAFATVQFISSLFLGLFAMTREESGLGYFFLSLFFTPLLAFPVLLIHSHSNAKPKPEGSGR